MYKILKAGKLAGNIYEMVVEAPACCKALSAGTVYHRKNG